MTRQFVAVEFQPGDRRTYTYHNDGEPLAIGDKVEVETPRGQSVVKVVSIPDKTPPFATKAIIRKHIPTP